MYPSGCIHCGSTHEDSVTQWELLQGLGPQGCTTKFVHLLLYPWLDLDILDGFSIILNHSADILII